MLCDNDDPLPYPTLQKLKAGSPPSSSLLVDVEEEGEESWAVIPSLQRPRSLSTGSMVSSGGGGGGVTSTAFGSGALDDSHVSMMMDTSSDALLKSPPPTAPKPRKVRV